MPTPGTKMSLKAQEKYLVAKKSAANEFLKTEVSPTAFRAMAFSVAPHHNIVGVGVGLKQIKGKSGRKAAIRFYVEKKVDKKSIPKDLLLPEKWDGLPTDVIEVGQFFALPVAVPATLKVQAATAGQKRIRPAKPGCSIGFQFPPPQDSYLMAGTFGALVKKGDQIFILSNNHVLADENRLKIGSEIFQPGLLDNGNAASDGIAKLSKFETLEVGANNAIDAALALLDGPKLASATFMPKVGKLKSGIPLEAAEGLKVMKVGRTTGYTEGVIFDISADVTVNYDLGKLRFDDQILIRGNQGKSFSAAGDSGSLIVAKTQKRPVALLFAGSASYTIANPILDVISRMAIELVI